MPIKQASPHSPTAASRGKSIFIIGGQLSNLGVQALMFCAVDHLSRRFPDHEIVLLSYRDHLRPETEKQAFRFHILPWDMEIKAWLLCRAAGNLRRLRRRSYDTRLMADLRSRLKHAAFMIDVSGFSLSSLWPFRVSLHYLLNLRIARRFGIPFYIFPQSFGPFDFSRFQKILLFPQMKPLLAYPEMIFAREASSLEAVTRFTRHNVHPQPHPDMVLLNKRIDRQAIYRRHVNRELPRLESPAVAVIPNLRVMERTARNQMYRIYRDMIDCLLQHGKKVYIFSHTGEIDFPTAERIRQEAAEKPDVFLIEQAFSVFEMEPLIQGFEFIVSSRYHAIVHAYKHGVPALAIGWAPKYAELLQRFEQSRYLTDVREGLDRDMVLSKLETLLNNVEQERGLIRSGMKVLAGMDNDTVFSAIEAP